MSLQLYQVDFKSYLLDFKSLNSDSKDYNRKSYVLPAYLVKFLLQN